MLTGDHSLPSFLSTVFLRPSHEVTNNEYRFYFNLMIKTIGLHRNLVKYIYSTLSHGLTFSFLNPPLLAVPPPPPIHFIQLSAGKCVQ